MGVANDSLSYVWKMGACTAYPTLVVTPSDVCNFPIIISVARLHSIKARLLEPKLLHIQNIA